MYAYIINNIVRELIPDTDTAFPDIPIEQRYPSDVIDKCIRVEDDADVRINMIYDPKTGEFKEREIASVSPMPEDIEGAKAYRISESKEKLAEWLENHPYTHTDGKKYSCTAEKQSLLNGNLASYERAVKAGIDYPLKWNSTGEECKSWDYSDLLILSLSIAGYVAPRVSAQQAIEIAINACQTVEEVNAVVINYDNLTSEN